jgi:hypothetical protein
MSSGMPTGTLGAPPAPPALLAAETLGQARAVLGELDGRIVELLAGVGHSVEHVAALVLDKAKLSDCDTEHVGRRLREALSMLADLWCPVSKGSRNPGAPRGRRQAGRRRRRDAPR